MHAVRVENLARWVNESSLKDAFSFCGKIKQCAVIASKITRKSVGIGFIVFNEAGGAINAVENCGLKLKGKAIKVSHCSQDVSESE